MSAQEQKQINDYIERRSVYDQSDNSALHCAYQGQPKTSTCSEENVIQGTLHNRDLHSLKPKRNKLQKCRKILYITLLCDSIQQ